MRIRWQRHAKLTAASAVIIALALCTATASAVSVTEYTSQSAFNSAVPGATASNFDGIAPSGGVSFVPVTVNGVNFAAAPGNLPVVWGTGNTYYSNSSFFSGQSLTVPGVASEVDVTLGGATGIGFTYGSYIDSGAAITVTVNNSNTFTLSTPTNAGISTSFVGFTSSTPITSVSFAEQGYTMDIIQFETGSLTTVPLPASAWLLLTALAGLGLLARRRQRDSLASLTAI
jgi:hypothetical protein